MPTYEQWKEWNAERESFRDIETLGWEADIARLEAHIKKLIEVAPKDKAGWMNLNALDVVNLLKKDLIKAKTYAGLMP